MFPTTLAVTGALGVGLIVQGLVATDRKRKLARVARDMIVTELCFNLREIELMDRSVQRTLQSQGRMLIRNMSTGLRKDVLEKLVAPDIIDTLNPVESGFMVEVFYQLAALDDRFEFFFERYEDRVHRPAQGDEALQASIDNWQYARLATQVNLVKFLIFAVVNQRGPATGDKARALRRGLAAADFKWLRSVSERTLGGEDTDLAVVGRTSDFQTARGGWQNMAAAVCWEHDWDECPIRAIALRPLVFPAG
jgi:hypothetical protein